MTAYLERARFEITPLCANSQVFIIKFSEHKFRIPNLNLQTSLVQIHTTKNTYKHCHFESDAIASRQTISSDSKRYRLALRRAIGPSGVQAFLKEKWTEMTKSGKSSCSALMLLSPVLAEDLHWENAAWPCHRRAPGLGALVYCH